MLHFVNTSALYLLDVSSAPRHARPTSHLYKCGVLCDDFRSQAVIRADIGWPLLLFNPFLPMFISYKASTTSQPGYLLRSSPPLGNGMGMKPHAHSLLVLAFVAWQILCFIRVVTMWMVGLLLLCVSAVWRLRRLNGHRSVERCLGYLHIGASMHTATVNTLAWVFLWVRDLYFLGQTRRC